MSGAAAALFAAILITLSAAGPAFAGPTQKILETCSNGKIPNGYSQQAYEQALKKLPPELAEYSDCSDLIHKAQLAAAGGGGSSGAGALGAAATAAPPTPTEQHALEHATHSGGAPVKVGKEAIHPGVVHVDIASALGTLPTPLLTLLAFLLACALWVVGRATYARVRKPGDDS
ncbi:MAG TPA: hypothetical protein VGI76_06290 [Solirubrobacteraceae bacterium]|jgi:hypothetical protein